MSGSVVAGTLALFDLDHTLIPFDSGMAWTRFLVARGALPIEAEAQYLDYCHQYLAGTLDIRAMHRASLAPLLRVARQTVREWQHEFERSMAPRIPPAALALVRRHQDAGDLCAIVTATDELVAAPFARLFGVDHLLATRAATKGSAADAPFTGEIDGEPCYREHKLTHLKRWLAALPTSLGDFTRSWFYSDSISDLPLLSAVSHPVAVSPDERLRAHARAHGWPLLESL